MAHEFQYHEIYESNKVYASDSIDVPQFSLVMDGPSMVHNQKNHGISTLTKSTGLVSTGHGTAMLLDFQY